MKSIKNKLFKCIGGYLNILNFLKSTQQNKVYQSTTLLSKIYTPIIKDYKLNNINFSDKIISGCFFSILMEWCFFVKLTCTLVHISVMCLKSDQKTLV